jgi:hypothetical protein
MRFYYVSVGKKKVYRIAVDIETRELFFSQRCMRSKKAPAPYGSRGLDK